MWRRCDLHRHTIPDGGVEFDPSDFVQRSVRDGLDVVAVTDHDRTDHIDAVVEEASSHEVIVVPGVEVSTDRGHILALAPSGDGRTFLEELCRRVQVREGETASFSRLIEVLGEQVDGGFLFRNHVILIGAHVDKPGSILGSNQAPSVSDQVAHAQQLQALEVVRPEILKVWQQGIKQTDVVMALVQGSDAHPYDEYEPRSTWLYLPEVSAQSLRHALATHEASISHQDHPPRRPDFWIESISFEGGPYSGRCIEFSPRANALIGPPSSGKSLIIDAIRHLFDLPCAIDDVQSSIERRLAKCLPDGTTVALKVTSGGKRHELQRVRGGSSAPATELKPVVFSQAELSRRSMEPTPSVELLDIHCPEGNQHKREIHESADQICSAFRNVVGIATEAGNLRRHVDNEQDGLQATQSQFRDLVGDEETAKALGDLGRLETWHKFAKDCLVDWQEGFEVPAEPDLPPLPPLETVSNIADYIPSNAISEALQQYQAAVCSAAAGLVETLTIESEQCSVKVTGLREEVQAGLGEAQFALTELAAQAENLRERLSDLEQRAAQLATLDDQIMASLDAMDELIDRASQAWKNLQLVRRAACTRVNRSMHSFFVRLIPEKLTGDVDEVLQDLRTGTYLHEASLQAIRDELDRKAFVRAAVQHLQFPISGGGEDGTGSGPSADAERVARAAMDREKCGSIAHLAALWPSDGIEMLQKRAHDEPVPFDNLTEGLKALAIKEISFAASQLPAVTDQPEDAVPTTAVFENLVPTVREQRSSRQFIIASHDANVVVSGDMDRVIVLPPNASEQPIVGTLFDTSIRKSAIALLEGGDRAFDLRRQRYGEYS